MQNTLSVEFSPQHYGLLMKAVESLGGRMQRNGKMATVVIGGQTVTINDGQATGPANLVNDLRVAYSRECVNQAQQWAKQKGWTFQQQAQNKATVSKGQR
jgi:hypothetical protein